VLIDRGNVHCSHANRIGNLLDLEPFGALMDAKTCRQGGLTSAV
jgi:hypothetical protein